MDSRPVTPDKRSNKVRPNNGLTALKFKNDSAKRKSFNFNEAVRSLDLALGRLKKTKVGEEHMTNTAPSSPIIRRGGTSANIFMNLSNQSSNINPGIDNASLMSMNFSHYELMRNLSQSTSNSESAFSSTTCNECSNPADNVLKDQHLEKYFRSAEMWSRNANHANNVHFELFKK